MYYFIFPAALVRRMPCLFMYFVAILWLINISSIHFIDGHPKFLQVAQLYLYNKCVIEKFPIK